MDFKAIQEILKFVNRSELTEVELEENGFKLTIRKQGSLPSQHVVYAAPAEPASAPQPMATAAAAPAGTPASAAAPEPVAEAARANDFVMNSPMIGTFYRRPSPEKDMFVKVGDRITKGQTLCIIEAMKLFNEIESEVEGTIKKILVEDQSPVEYDQPLFEIDLD